MILEIQKKQNYLNQISPESSVRTPSLILCLSQILFMLSLEPIFAKLSLSFSFSLTELVIVSANPATRHPEKYKFLVLKPIHE